jgi:hypothetical protein
MDSFTTESETKRLGLLKELVPKMKRMAFLGDFRNSAVPEAMERSGIGGQALELACQPIGYTKRFGCEPRF